ncbi:MAG: substrate-binding domain-containing protein, partial [Anaerovoracaceae bacterium]
ASKGNNFSSFNVEPRETFDRSKVLSWLEDLPKPVALFCCDDAHALYITETCNMAGLSVPKDIAVLGVDNDELLCGISDPPVSSVELDVERGGYETCALLHRQIMNSTRQPFNVVITPVEVVQRQSSYIYNIKDPNVAKIVAFIDSNYNTNLDINGILKLVPLSRRSVETKFRKETGTTIYQYILKCRVEHLAHLLLTSDRPVSEIADEVGFGDNGSFSRIFRKMKGCSPQEYRQKNCAFRQ